MPPRLSQNQRSVLALYRRGLRSIRSKPETSRHDFTLYLRHFFRHPAMGGGVSMRDFGVIDYLKRRGDKMIESMFENDSVKSIQLPPAVREEMYELGLGSRWLPRDHSKRPQ